MKHIAFLLLAIPACAQVFPVDNAQVQRRAFSGSVDAMIRQVGNGPAWVGWVENARPGQRDTMCGWNESRQTGMHLEGFRQFAVMVRVEGGKAGKLRVSSPDCRLDAGGLPFLWIENVPPQQSIAWLKVQVSEKQSDSEILAIVLHEPQYSNPAIQAMTESSQPEKVREKAVFWMGNSMGKEGAEQLRRLLATESNTQVRKKITFALSQSKEPEALTTLLQTAKNDKSNDVRGEAIFWLSQKAGNKQAAQAVAEAVEDPDRQVKEKAVFALSQLPNHEGVPKLLELARSHPDSKVRKKAIFWLGQSKDPRAVEYFEQVLR